MSIKLYFAQSVAGFIRKEGTEVKKRRRNQLLKSGNRCHYCGCVMDTRTAKEGQRHKKKMVTIDHIYSVMDIRRLIADFKTSTVLSCYACNYRKAQKEHLAIYKGFDYNTTALILDTDSKSIILSPEIFKTA